VCEHGVDEGPFIERTPFDDGANRVVVEHRDAIASPLAARLTSTS
jgi:hypothetical protein